MPPIADSTAMPNRHTRTALARSRFGTLADFVFAIATNYKKVPTVSTSAQINFLGQPKGTQLFGESVCIKDGKSTCLYEVKITDELGTKVALAVINGMKLGK